MPSICLGPRVVAGVRNAYASHAGGATGYYVDSGATYVNPHDAGVREMLVRAVQSWPDLWAPPGVGRETEGGDAQLASCEGGRILDLSCGSGEVTAALVAAGVDVDRIDACDPFTGEAYLRRVGRAAETWSFEDIARGEVSDRRWRVVVCSFAMHLCERAYLPTLCMMVRPRPDPLFRGGWLDPPLSFAAAGFIPRAATREHPSLVTRRRVRMPTSSTIA